MREQEEVPVVLASDFGNAERPPQINILRGGFTCSLEDPRTTREGDFTEAVPPRETTRKLRLEERFPAM